LVFQGNNLFFKAINILFQTADLINNAGFLLPGRSNQLALGFNLFAQGIELGLLVLQFVSPDRMNIRRSVRDSRHQKSQYQQPNNGPSDPHGPPHRSTFHRKISAKGFLFQRLREYYVISSVIWLYFGSTVKSPFLFTPFLVVIRTNQLLSDNPPQLLIVRFKQKLHSGWDHREH
jgi:hypothetical protein